MADEWWLGDVVRSVSARSNYAARAAIRHEPPARGGRLPIARETSSRVPRGTKEISDADVMAAAKAAGLVDVKVVRVSEVLTGEKLVIPVTKR